MRFITSLIAIGLVALTAGRALAQAPENPLLSTAASRSAAVAAILDTPLDTPASQLSAVLTLIDLGETDVAAEVWKTLAKAEIDGTVSADLAEKFGTARLMKLARLEQPAGEDLPAEFAGASEFISRCIDAASKRARNPERLAKLVAEVNDPAEEVRQAARVDLAVTGVDGAKACLEALAQANDETTRANLMLAVSNLKFAAKPLLLAALADSRGHFRRDVAELSGYLQIEESIPFLAVIVAGNETDPDLTAAAIASLSKFGITTAPNDSEARTLLVREIKQLETKKPSRFRVDSEKAIWWLWNPTPADGPAQYVAQEFDSATSRSLSAHRLAKLLSTCGDPTQKQRELALVYYFETLQILGEATPGSLADSYSTTEVSAALGNALKSNRLKAVLSCIEILSSRDDPSILISGTGRPSPLASALKHGSREIRFAALEAVMKLNPQRSFAGASLVPKTLWEFAAGAGPAQAVAGSSVTLRADDWAAQLREKGYAAVPANSGRATLQSALNSPRIELLLVDSDIGKPRLREVIYQLRSHELTARMPVAVLCSLINLESAQRVAAADDKLFAVARPHTEKAMQDVVEQLQQLSDEPASEEQRTQRAVQAIQWISNLLDQDKPYNELRRNAQVLSQTVHIPSLVEPSLKTLARVGSAESQLALINFASQEVQSFEVRQLAAEAFAASIERFGKQLRLQQIQRQYDRYNASESAGPDTQQVLSLILDALEGNVAEASTP